MMSNLEVSNLLPASLLEARTAGVLPFTAASQQPCTLQSLSRALCRGLLANVSTSKANLLQGQ